MVKKKLYKLMTLFFMIVVILCGCGETVKENVKKEEQLEKENVTQQQNDTTTIETETVNEKLGMNLPVSRGLAAKMISLTFNDNADLEAMDKEINFNDVSEGDWYYKYINAAVIGGYMKGSGDEFLPLEPLSLYEAQVLIDKIYPQNKTKIKLTEESRNKPISYTLWEDLFQKAITSMCGENNIGNEYGLYEKELFVFSTPGNSEMPAWTMATDMGIFTFSGYAMDAYSDKRIKVLAKGNEVLSIIEVKENSPILEGAYIKKVEDGIITVFVGGGERKYSFSGELNVEIPCIADLKINDGQILELAAIVETKRDVIKRANSKYIELAKEGEIETRSGFKIYSEKGDAVGWKSLSNLTCGSEIADFYIKEGKIVAGVIRREAKPEKIRVVISKTGYSGYTHESVSITSDGGFYLNSGNEVKEYRNGEILNIDSGSDLFQSKRISIIPIEENGKTEIINIKRPGGVSPQYYGIIEIEKRDDGFVIVNEVDMEKYLYSVVPSEMPTSFGVEAAKVQAVTARSFAYNQFYANKYYEYGANVDDTILCQVYNNSGENKTSVEAVDSTKGVCLTYGGEVISANFFSTSSGMRANSGEVWANSGNKKFPTDTQEYTSAGKEYKSGDYGDLSTEEAAANFFKNMNVDGYDKQSGWFRWNVRISGEELNAIINSNIKTAYERSPYLIKTLQANGTYKSREIEKVGNINDLVVTKRGEGGNVMELVIKGSEAEVKVMTEYNIRNVVAPVQKIEGKNPIMIYCMNDIIMTDYAMMPSAFFTMEKDIQGGKLNSITFYGGGNGHGVGMSQNGVKGLIDEGFQYEEILKHYYKGVELEKM